MDEPRHRLEAEVEAIFQPLDLDCAVVHTDPRAGVYYVDADPSTPPAVMEELCLALERIGLGVAGIDGADPVVTSEDWIRVWAFPTAWPMPEALVARYRPRRYRAIGDDD